MTHFRLERDESLGDGVYRVISELTDEALQHLEFPDSETEGIHEARKACKKARALARLVRPSLEDYREVNRHFRDAARQLGPIRDPQAFHDTFETLASTPAANDELGALRSHFESVARQATRRLSVEEDRIESARKLISAGRLEADDWQIEDRFESVAGGVERTYGRARDGLADASASGAVADFHEWRKRTKYLWYQIRLLRNAAPSVLRPLANRLHDLSDALGDSHDLALMADEVAATDTPASSKEAFRVVARGYRIELQERAFSLGRRLFVEAPSAFVARLGAYWEIWELGDEFAAGRIADVSPASNGPMGLGSVR